VILLIAVIYLSVAILGDIVASLALNEARGLIRFAPILSVSLDMQFPSPSFPSPCRPYRSSWLMRANGRRYPFSAGAKPRAADKWVLSAPGGANSSTFAQFFS
jgi:hypothetical protein